MRRSSGYKLTETLKTYIVCPSTTTFTLSVEKMNTTDVKDKHDGMLSQIGTAF